MRVAKLISMRVRIIQLCYPCVSLWFCLDSDLVLRHKLFCNHKIVLSLCTCVALVKVCCACEVFDYAALGRVIFKSYNCVILV